jgi:hypothetical protein
MIPDPAPPFEVGMSQLLRERIERLTDLAHARGIGPSFDAAVDRIMELLRTAPRESGDPLRHLPGMSSVLYRAYRNDLIVHYTVHDRIPMVTLWQFEPDPHHPLAPPPANGD